MGASLTMEKEHVMNHGESDDLWCSTEETLQSAESCKGCIAWGECGRNYHDQSQSLRPKQNRQSIPRQ